MSLHVGTDVVLRVVDDAMESIIAATLPMNSHADVCLSPRAWLIILLVINR